MKRNILPQIAAIASCLVFAACADDGDPQTEADDVREVAFAPTESPDETNERRNEAEQTELDVDPEPEVDQEPEVEPEPEVDQEPEPCTLDNDCIDTFPTTFLDSTLDGDRAWDVYSCDVEVNESGPERVYRIEIAHAGFLAAEVVSEDVDVDIDLHLLLERDPDSCMDRGHYTAGSWLEPGTYWVVADTWVDDEGVEYAGEFEIAFNLVTPARLQTLGIDPRLAEDSIKSFSNAWLRDDTRRFEYTIVDFSMHSADERQWIYHLATDVLLFNTTVAHGEASVDGDDPGYSTLFSNIPGSHQSSLGLIRTAETYFGDYGYSLRLDGLEPGYNDKVRERFIVVHPWNGNHPQIVSRDGYVTPTWGCPSVDPDISEHVINTIKDGALMFFWHPDSEWYSGSTYF